MDLARTVQLWITQFLEPLAAAANDRFHRRQLFTALGVPLAVDIEDLLDDLEPLLRHVASLTQRLAGRELQNVELIELLTFLGEAQDASTAVTTLAEHCATVSPDIFDPARLASDLAALLTLRFFYTNAPVVAEIAVLSTLVRHRESGQMPMLALDRTGELLADPLRLLSEHYLGPDGLRSLNAVADADRAADRLFPRLASLLRRMGFGAVYLRDPDLWIPDTAAVSNRALIVQLPLPTGSGAGVVVSFRSDEEGGAAAILAPFGTLSFSQPVGTWRVTAEASGTIRGFAVGPDGVKFSEDEPTPSFQIRIRSQKEAGADEMAFRSGSTGTRIEIGQFQWSVDSHVAAGVKVIDLMIDASSAALVVEGGDGFLQQILPAEGLRSEFDLGIGWSNRRGLCFRGSAGLEAILPIQKELFGVLKAGSVYLALRPDDSAIEMTAAATVSVALGPITASIERVGLQANVSFPAGSGNLGPVNLTLEFKPPDGAGLAIDAGVVVGGGYLLFDRRTEQYAGVVQLEIAELLNLSAFGLITTRMPDGSPGFSLLVLIASRFTPAVQLGYGFTLNGVGGLLGVNRTAAADVLRTGLRAGTLGSVLFPVDPIRNAPQIVSDLASVFPPAAERFVFGPMAILGWGTPTLLTLEMGLILELPAPVRLLMLGRLRVLLPEERYPVVRLQLDSLGVVDFTSGDVALDAVLFDSMVAQYAVTGEMALRANFGKTPGFVLAVGGFHPGFTAPAGFPALERVAISLATGDNPRLRLAAYLAVTTNTVQFGALLDLYAMAGPFSVEGLLGFDAILHMRPFGFNADLGAMVAVKLNGQALLAAMLQVSFTGPTPWHAWGRANFRLFGTSTSVAFDVQIGDPVPPPLPSPVLLRPLLLAALHQPGNWATRIPHGEHPIVTLREQPRETATLVHPLASLEVRQTVVPLKCDITRFGNTVPEGENRFELRVDALAGSDGEAVIASPEDVTELFAPAQFWEMSDDQKLGAPAFVEQCAGIRFALRGYACGPAVADSGLVYEEVRLYIRATDAVPQAISGAEPERPTRAAMVSEAFVARVAARGAAGRAPFGRTGTARYRTLGGSSERGFGLRSPTYAVVDVDGVPADTSALTPLRAGLTLAAQPVTDASVAVLAYSDAVAAVRALSSEHPDRQRRLRIVPSYG